MKTKQIAEPKDTSLVVYHQNYHGNPEAELCQYPKRKHLGTPINRKHLKKHPKISIHILTLSLQTLSKAALNKKTIQKEAVKKETSFFFFFFFFRSLAGAEGSGFRRHSGTNDFREGWLWWKPSGKAGRELMKWQFFKVFCFLVCFVGVFFFFFLGVLFLGFGGLGFARGFFQTVLGFETTGGIPAALRGRRSQRAIR